MPDVQNMTSEDEFNEDEFDLDEENERTYIKEVPLAPPLNWADRIGISGQLSDSDILAMYV